MYHNLVSSYNTYVKKESNVHIFGGISSLDIIETLQSSQIPSGLSVSFVPQILQSIFQFRVQSIGDLVRTYDKIVANVEE